MTAPVNAGEVAETLRRWSTHGRTICLEGCGSKGRMAGPVQAADEYMSMAPLNRVLQYEPHDLTISVEAGLRWSDLTSLLAENRQMIPLDPPFGDSATVGGVIASNSNGPRRRLYGTARDMVIGMTFITLDGKVVQSGGMVVKNVAGLDMAKLMIGSFGTLAAITVVNFKVTPVPEVERSFLLPFDSAAGAIAARDRILSGALQPAAIDLLNPAAAKGLGHGTWLLAVRAAGNAALADRYEHELASLGDGREFEGELQNTLWRRIQEFTPAFLMAYPQGAVARVSCTLKETQTVMQSFDGMAVARAGSGVCYGYWERIDEMDGWLAEAARHGWKCVTEFASEEAKRGRELWPAPGGDFALMQRVKNLFDPGNVLNRGRLYGRI